MKQQTKKKKKRQTRASKPAAGNETVREGDQDEQLQQQQQQQQQQEGSKSLYALMEAFDSISLEEASSAYKEASGDVNKAAEFLANLTDSGDDPSTSSVSSGISSLFDSGSGTGSSSSCAGSSSGSLDDRFLEADIVCGKGSRGSNKQKRVVAVAGTVSTVLGKDYVKASPRRDSAKAKPFGKGLVIKEEEAEQFLCSMLGDDCELSMAVVRDVLCECGYDVEKALDALLDLSASSYEHCRNSNFLNDTVSYKEDTRFLNENIDNLTDGSSDCTSHSSECELHDSIWGCDCRTYSQALTSFRDPSPTNARSNESNLPQRVLESLFNISKNSEHEPSTMNWRNVVKKMQSLGHGVNTFTSSETVAYQDIYASGDEYHLFRESAQQHWDSRKMFYQKAAAAYSKGERQYAAFLSDQGQIQTKLAREADKKASQDIFEARNKGIVNVVTIDLHGQHVQPAMRLLKLHLLFGTFVRSIQTLRVITGCGSHGVGKSKLKQSVIKLLEKEGIEWREENQGVVLIKLDGHKEYSFLDSDSDAD